MSAPSSPVFALDQQYVFPTYDRAPVVFVRGEGAELIDENGARYLDCLSGIAVNALGYNHPRIVATLSDQAAKILHVCNLFHNEYQAQLARKLCSISGLQSAFFCNSGTEAIEAAIKVARNHAFRASGGAGHHKHEIVALEDSFHGRTLGALSLTGQRKYREPFEPLIPGIRFVPANDAAALQAAVNEKACALIMEPIQGEGGIRVLNREFLGAARSLCDRHGALLIFDEVQCGLGRTGFYLSYQGKGVQPDLVTLAKPLGLGIPMGALLGTRATRDDLTLGTHGSTFGGGPLACRMSLEFFQIMEEERLLERIRTLGNHFAAGLHDLKKKFSFVKEVRGEGLILGMELDFPGKDLVRTLLQRGYVINCAHERVLRFLPPYIITEVQLDRLIRALDDAFSGL
ncbi:MAG: aspartate aminotransferase family protein [Acidobacteriia bacterium]|nr:aspartate aminotransferase family protein [Terriglobia bacterium]